jgi:hypothetical protein
MKLEKILELFNDFDNTNCYDSVDVVCENIKTDNISDIYTLKNMINMHIKYKDCFFYRLDISIKEKESRSRAFIFNHSFGIVQCQNKLTLCDAWDGIHQFKCREIVNISKFDKWLDKLVDHINHLVNNNILHNLFELFGENPFSENMGSEKDWSKDIEELVKRGDWVENWDSIQIKEIKKISTPLIKISIKYGVVDLK